MGLFSKKTNQSELDHYKQLVYALGADLGRCTQELNILRAQVNGIRDWQRPVESNLARLTARHDAR